MYSIRPRFFSIFQASKSKPGPFPCTKLDILAILDGMTNIGRWRGNVCCISIKFCNNCGWLCHSNNQSIVLAPIISFVFLSQGWAIFISIHVSLPGILSNVEARSNPPFSTLMPPNAFIIRTLINWAILNHNFRQRFAWSFVIFTVNEVNSIQIFVFKIRGWNCIVFVTIRKIYKAKKKLYNKAYKIGIEMLSTIFTRRTRAREPF